MTARDSHIEWPTVAIFATCAGLWLGSTFAAGHGHWWPALLVAVYATTLHSSCQHEALHGHPTRNRRLNEALVFPAPGLFFPYRRFLTLHLQHHNDQHLTDPYEDPETNFMAAADWDRLPQFVQAIRQFNNTLIGRLLIGPAIGVIGFWLADGKRLLTGDKRIWKAWILHATGVAAVLVWIVGVCGLSPWFYLLSVAYPAYALLSVRTFLEHRAEEAVPARTCIVEDASGVWSLLFLNNNLHVVHLEQPRAPWYALPALYRREKTRYLALNGGYVFPSYWAIIRRFALVSKAPVPHPFLRRKQQ